MINTIVKGIRNQKEQRNKVLIHIMKTRTKITKEIETKIKNNIKTNNKEKHFFKMPVMLVQKVIKNKNILNTNNKTNKILVMIKIINNKIKENNKTKTKINVEKIKIKINVEEEKIKIEIIVIKKIITNKMLIMGNKIIKIIIVAMVERTRVM